MRKRSGPTFAMLVYVALQFAQGGKLARAVQVDQPAGSAALFISAGAEQDAQVRRLSDDLYEVRATGAHPRVTLSADSSRPGLHFLSFSYFSVQPTQHVRLEYGPSVNKLQTYDLPGLGQSEAFSPYDADLSRVPGWDSRSPVLRLGIDLTPGQTVQIRTIRLREPEATEASLIARKLQWKREDLQLEQQLRGYLHRCFAGSIDSVWVNRDTVAIAASISASYGTVGLLEIRPYEDITAVSATAVILPLKPHSGRYNLTVGRYDQQPGERYDRLLSKWALVRRVAGRTELLSHGRYADSVTQISDQPEETPATKKGVAGIDLDRPLQDIKDLGIQSTTLNINLNFLRGSPAEGNLPFFYQGKTYYADARSIGRYDRILQYAAERRLLVACILLVPPARDFHAGDPGAMLVYPQADPSGIYVMPNFSSKDGVATYAAALSFLAERYSRPDRRYGHVQDWIMHNEIDAGWVWTNAGDKSELTYLDLYTKSMRTMYNIARQYNSHAKVFISLTHFWNWTEDSHYFLPRQLLQDLVEYSEAEGDFPWAIAYHPYPESLRDPRTWEDARSDFTFDTPFISFRNIEVLDAWIKQRSHLYQSKIRRTVFLSEQGFNSPDYSTQALDEQAAALVYAWKKVQSLETITALQYHNWVDNREEGGLRIGLRRFPDDDSDPAGPKPIWSMYRKLGTPEQPEAEHFAEKVIGEPAWRAIQHTEPIPESSSNADPRAACPANPTY